MRYAQLVMGPAGSGKSTYCSAMQQHAASERNVIDIVNLDPAAEYFDYEPLVDIRELIQLDDAMEDDELQFGPNGGLVFCVEYLLENSSWLEEKLGDVDDDYIIFDCPGQIELYTHMTVIRQLITILHNLNFRICGIFLVDSQFMVDGSKFLSGTMAALSVMINLELPHINILSKMDLLSKSAKKQLDKYLEPDPHSLLADMEKDSWNEKYRNLTEAVGRLIEDYSLVRFYPLNIKDEESIADIKLTIDNIIQYGEDVDVKIRDFDDPAEDDDRDTNYEANM
ncbi:PREDICTED: GPN-loop GTPase 3 [Dufourea novaeangliae]|uniref:GPN-loop GTPase 3 n=1 Tax=Dufourea novaeangliae TaxID=178035 RepID=A0A154P0H4_DUFNO|nr:PREDICTED: GPN-loop GTPase 3 [Dufourea novaeangliae]KZC05351.1 GPN-loop GTPase 3 [Dufourea novaeangliae]